LIEIGLKTAEKNSAQTNKQTDRQGSPSNKVAWAEAYLHTKWHLDLCSHLAATDMGRKLGGCALLGEGSWVPI